MNLAMPSAARVAQLRAAFPGVLGIYAFGSRAQGTVYGR